MTAKFAAGGFRFACGEHVPVHEDGFPGDESRDPSLWHLDGRDQFSNESYLLASNLSTEKIATTLVEARIRFLNITQPPSTSGGRNGIQDCVILIRPTVPRSPEVK